MLDLWSYGKACKRNQPPLDKFMINFTISKSKGFLKANGSCGSTTNAYTNSISVKIIGSILSNGHWVAGSEDIGMDQACQA